MDCAVPGLADGGDDVVIGRPEAVGEEVLLEVEPEAFDGVQFGRVGGEEDGREVGGITRSWAMGQPA